MRAPCFFTEKDVRSPEYLCTSVDYTSRRYCVCTYRSTYYSITVLQYSCITMFLYYCITVLPMYYPYFLYLLSSPLLSSTRSTVCITTIYYNLLQSTRIPSSSSSSSFLLNYYTHTPVSCCHPPPHTQYNQNTLLHLCCTHSHCTSTAPPLPSTHTPSLPSSLSPPSLYYLYLSVPR